MLIAVVLVLSILVSALWCVGNGTFQSLAWLWQLPVGIVSMFVIQAVLIFLVVWILSKTINLEKEQEEDSKFFRWMLGVLDEAAHTILMMRVHTKGLEKVPTDTRFLLVCNHQHLSDVGVLISCFKKSKIAFISKQENRTMPVIGKIMHMTSSQTLDREDDRQALRVILKCIQLVKDGEVSMAVFPEGTRSKDGKVHAFRNGCFKIAQKANVPIVVCTINGTNQLFHNLKKLKTTHIDLHLVDVIQPEELKGKTTAEIGDRVYEMMIADLGEEFRMEVVQNT